MKRIALITTTRAEFGLLAPVLRCLREYEDDMMQVQLVVSGTHLLDAYGMTIQEIKEAGDRIDKTVIIEMNTDTEEGVAETYAETVKKFTVLFLKNAYDAILLLGDRFETMAIAVAAGLTHIPVFHMCGGDTTEGALDEWMRHSITKIAYLHFVTNDQSRQRVIQLGEHPERVFNYGSTSIDNIMNLPFMTKEEALESIGLPLCDYALCTYQPVTMEGTSSEEQLEGFLEAIRAYPKTIFIVTKANADQGGNRINQILEREHRRIPNMRLFASLGVKRYIGLMRHCNFVFGNSSSGIIEAPTCKVATVNIGDRQRGRLRANSVIDCDNNAEDIIEAIRKAQTPEHKEICRKGVSPYGAGNAAKQIAQKCIEVLREGAIDLKKSFYDCGGKI